ncbi:MAG: ATP-dependent 6-phosphofructokinase [Holosporales bacterium]|jgi:6-phosphofructokinase 1|nr:ATP-dependent 6-phosphofructokinase [Holosporales bacterium]
MNVNKRIGILTSGGDCSGLNSAIRAAFIRSQALGYELVGIKRGLRGLADPNPDFLILDNVLCNESLLTSSGSVIYSNTDWVSSTIGQGKTTEDIKNSIYDGYQNLGLTGLIFIGGDGSLSLMKEFLIENLDINIVAIPKTIDNDVAITDFSIGFHTAVEVVSNSIENIRSTAKSHERAMVVEVMGRDAGFIAMYAGIASGVDAILIPEFKYSIESLKSKVKSCYDSGQNHCLIVAAEAVENDEFKHDEEFVDGVVKYSQLQYRGIAQYIAQKLKAAGFNSRAVVLGHTQRGGKTAIDDRILASAFGAEAVNLIDSRNSGKLLCYIKGKIEAINITELQNSFSKKISKSDICVNIAKCFGVYIGEV